MNKGLDLEFDEEDEKTAEQLDLLAQLDYYLLLEIILKFREGKPVFSLEEISDLVDDFSIPQNRILGAINRLERKGFIHSRLVKKKDGTSDIIYHSDEKRFSILGLPPTSKEIEKMDIERIKEIMYEKIREVGRDFEWEIRKKDTLQEIERIKEEMEAMKGKMEESQNNMLRNMIGIFGIFVAIFSFIVIGANTALSIQPVGFFAVGAIVGILMTIFTLLILFLLVIKRWFTK